MTTGSELPSRKKKEWVKLNGDEKKVACTRLMAGAQAHQRASVYCHDNPDAKIPNIDWLFFNVVSLELILMSVEQSLRLLLLLHYDIIRDDTNHTPHVLYTTVRNKSGGKVGIRSKIVAMANTLAGTQKIPTMDEKEIVACLRKHNSSYTNFRYFQLNRQGRLNPQWEIKNREVQILHCVALGLITLNMDEMTTRNIPIMSSMSAIPESRMTDDLRAVKERLLH